MGGAAAAIFGGAEAAAGAVVVDAGIMAGMDVAEGLATGALTDIGGGLALDGAGALIDIGTGTALTDVGGGAFLNSATGALVDAAGSALPEISSGVFQAADGTLMSSAGDVLTQSATDGSLLNTTTGEIIDATGGGAQASLNIANTGVTPEMLAKYGPMAYKVLNTVLGPATKALAGPGGFKPVGQGGLFLRQVLPDMLGEQSVRPAQAQQRFPVRCSGDIQRKFLCPKPSGLPGAPGAEVESNPACLADGQPKPNLLQRPTAFSEQCYHS